MKKTKAMAYPCARNSAGEEGGRRGHVKTCARKKYLQVNKKKLMGITSLGGVVTSIHGSTDMTGPRALEERPAEEQPLTICRGRRALKRVNYASSIKLRKTTVQETEKKLYPATIVEKDSGGNVKVHYVGYSSVYDEWKNQKP